MNIARKLADLSTSPAYNDAYDAGYDCGKNGANTHNCHFSFFSSPSLTKEWERGKSDAEKQTGQPCRNGGKMTGEQETERGMYAASVIGVMILMLQLKFTDKELKKMFQARKIQKVIDYLSHERA